MKNKLIKEHAVLFFRKWSGKSYSLFSALSKTVAISVLSVIYFLSTPIISVAIEPDSTEVKMEYDLDEIEVSAQRTPALYSQVARIVSVIDRKEIEATAAQSVQEMLEYVAGIDVRQRGAEGVQADVSIRGGTSDQLLILLNGINITDPQTGHHNLDLPVNLSQIERIEVLEGPAARIYGPNAFSGAINIVTKQNEQNKINLATSGGSFGFFNGNAGCAFGTQKIRNSLAFNYKRSDGYIDNTDFHTLNGFYTNRLNTKNGTLDFQAGASVKGFGANSFYSPKYPNQYETTKNLFTSLKWKDKGKLHWTPALYYRRHLDKFELFRDNPASWYTGHNYHQTNIWGANLNSWFEWKGGKTAFGAEYRSEHILSNVLGKKMNKPKDVPGEDAQYTKSAKRNILSAFLDHSVYWKRWALTAGVMGNWISEKDGLNFFPGIDISYSFWEHFKCYMGYNTSLRMPTFTDLYYEGTTNVGNSDLKPEKSATIEGGIKFSHPLIKGHWAVFYRKGRNIIDWVKTGSTEVWQSKNLTELKTLGTEIRLQVLLQDKFGAAFPTIQLAYLYNDMKKKDADFISHYALDYLRHKFTGSFRQKLYRNTWFDLKWIYQDRAGSYAKYENTKSVGETEYQPFWLFDGKISYSQKHWMLFVAVKNIFDKKYNDIGNVTQPGRWLKAGMSYELPL